MYVGNKGYKNQQILSTRPLFRAWVHLKGVTGDEERRALGLETEVSGLWA